MCVEESIHVIFYETNHLAEKGTQTADDGEFGLVDNNEEQANQGLLEAVAEQTQESCPLEPKKNVQNTGRT